MSEARKAKREMQKKKIEIAYFNIQTEEVFTLIKKWEAKHQDGGQGGNGTPGNGVNTRMVWTTIRQLVKNRKGPIQFKDDGLPVFHVKVPPKSAAALLKANLFNRSVNKRHEKALADRIVQGDFKDDGDHIEISRDGTFLNGQHRARAVEISDIPTFLTFKIGAKPEVIYGRDVNVKARTNFDNACIVARREGHKLFDLAEGAKGQIKSVLNAVIQEKKGVPLSYNRFKSDGISTRNYLDAGENYFHPMMLIKGIFFPGRGKPTVSGIGKSPVGLAFLKLLLKYPNESEEILRGARLLLGTGTTEHKKDETISVHLRNRMVEKFPGKGGNQHDAFNQYCEVCYFMEKWMKVDNSKVVSRCRKADDMFKLAQTIRLPKPRPSSYKGS